MKLRDANAIIVRPRPGDYSLRSSPFFLFSFRAKRKDERSKEKRKA